MVVYNCERCKKNFSDKSKYTYHINRTRPCKSFGVLLDKEIINQCDIASLKYEKEPILENISSKNTHSNVANGSNKSGKTAHSSLGKLPVFGEYELEEKIRKKTEFITNKCYICKEEHKNTFLEHLISCHDVEKEDRFFSFVKKNSGLSIYQNNENCGDIVILVFDNKKGLLFTTTNLHNLQRHKKEKYNDIREFIYYPCKDIKLFKEMWKEELYKMKIYDDKKKMDVDLMYPCVQKIIKVINNEECKKNNSEYKSSFYYQCPFCDFKDNNKEHLNLHLDNSHKSIRFSSNFVVNDEHRDKIMNIIEKNNKTIHEKPIQPEEFKCIGCSASFTSRFNLNRHIKDSCKKADTIYLLTLANRNTELKDNLSILIESNKKLKEENEKLKEVLIGNQDIIKGSNETLKNSVNYINNTTNIIQNNNILFNINDFGQEDISHIQYQFVEGIIKEMNTDSLVKFIEEVHYGNPRNCNVMIPTNIPSIQDNNMLLIKKGDRWVVDKRKNVIDGMLTVNMDRIVDVYEDISEQLKPSEKQNFEGYVDMMEAEERERGNAIQKTEQLLIDHKPTNNLLLENCKIQQNNYVGNKLVGSVELTLPQKMSNIEDEEKDKFLEMMKKPTIVDLEDSLKSFQLP